MLQGFQRRITYNIGMFNRFLIEQYNTSFLGRTKYHPNITERYIYQKNMEIREIALSRRKNRTQIVQR
ncbi:MAG: hypothetical protein ACTSWY_02965 [Promethearchaeota archaeon]